MNTVLNNNGNDGDGTNDGGGTNGTDQPNPDEVTRPAGRTGTRPSALRLPRTRKNPPPSAITAPSQTMSNDSDREDEGSPSESESGEDDVATKSQLNDPDEEGGRGTGI